ncbi:MAG: hypothetical protein IJV39_05120 [Ruminococcus sp.]|nr:hypothetical protein [Ruminococcus sp.]
MSKINVNKGEQKIMNNNPTVSGVNFVNDLIGGEEGSKSLGFKVMVAVLVTAMVVVGSVFLIYGKPVSGIIFIVIAAILFITTTGIKHKSKKYKIDKKIVDEIEPLFKD